MAEAQSVDKIYNPPPPPPLEVKYTKKSLFREILKTVFCTLMKSIGMQYEVSNSISVDCSPGRKF